MSVFDTNYPNFEVLFVDNASTDGSVEFVEKKFGQNPRLRIIQNERNLGFTEGNNVGIRNAKGEYIALLNSDAKADRQWLKELVKTIRSPEIGAVQSKLLQMSSPDVIDCAGGLIDYYGYHIERGRGEKSCKYTETGEIFYAKGAGALIKREILEKTGLFDPEIFMYFDETDLCWRIWLSGYKVLFAPKSIVYHASGSTASKLQEKTRAYYYIRNHILVLLKNYDLSNMFKAVAVSIVFEFRNMVLFFARHKPQVGIAVIEALSWNLFHSKYAWKKRQVIQRLVRKVSDKQIKKIMLKPYPPFPLYLVFSRFRYLKKKQNINT
jgi:GT2 family glycosyltransferase